MLLSLYCIVRAWQSFFSFSFLVALHLVFSVEIQPVSGGWRGITRLAVGRRVEQLQQATQRESNRLAWFVGCYTETWTFLYTHVCVWKKEF